MASQMPSVQVESTQNPPPFLSGVPMVNPGGFNAPSSVSQLPQQLQQGPSPVPSVQQPMSQTQSVVSNMAAYSSSKYTN